MSLLKSSQAWVEMVDGGAVRCDGVRAEGSRPTPNLSCISGFTALSFLL